jgi:F0F1-type ATP synthase assembly protein I
MSEKRQETPERGSSAYVNLGRLSAIITILPATMAAGWALGHYAIDRLFGVAPWGSVFFILAGGGVGFYEITRILISSQDDRRKDRSQDSHDDPH